MKTGAAIGLFVAGAMFAGVVPSFADCRCAANGNLYDQGELACLTVSGRSWLARCGKVLNNSSWEKVADGCPQSRILPERARQLQGALEEGARVSGHAGEREDGAAARQRPL